jgi:hypothetical protein
MPTAPDGSLLFAVFISCCIYAAFFPVPLNSYAKQDKKGGGKASLRMRETFCTRFRRQGHFEKWNCDEFSLENLDTGNGNVGTNSQFFLFWTTMPFFSFPILKIVYLVIGK